MSEYLDQALLAIRQRRAEISQKSKAMEIEDRELAIAERTLVRLREGPPPVLGEGPAESPPPVAQPELPATTPAEMPIRWKPPAGRTRTTGPLAANVVPSTISTIGPARVIVDGLTLEPVTANQATVFRALVRLRKMWSSAQPLYYSAIQKEAGDIAPLYHLRALETKGYAKNFSSAGDPDWWPLAQGKIKIQRGGDATGDARVEDGEIAEQAPAALVDKLREASAPSEDAAPVNVIKATFIDTAQGYATKPAEQEGDDDPVDIEDLTKSQSEVLCIIVELCEDGGTASANDILSLSELDSGRLEGVIVRLTTLDLIGMNAAQGRRWTPTPTGIALAAALKADEGV